MRKEERKYKKRERRKEDKRREEKRRQKKKREEQRKEENRKEEKREKTRQCLPISLYRLIADPSHLQLCPLDEKATKIQCELLKF